ncbi:MAG TPA: trypsin-like peptidase domain-containing protein [Streptosporangiaceae bacterium]|jgi:putative serine protease PepD
MIPGTGYTAVGVSPAARRPRRLLRHWRLAAAACGLAIGCTALGGVVGGLVAVHSVQHQLDPGFNLGPLPPAAADRTPTSVAAIAARDTPSVVMIKVDNGAGTGSGFVVSGGYIVTNNHVVTLDGETTGASLQIYLGNGSSVAGQLVGRDPYSDIAVIRAAGVAGLPALPLGNSDGVAVGDPVIAIGSPLGLADTVTSGIVSALDRPIQPGAGNGTAPEVYFDAIQTDAPINPGSSGGPLVNARGQVIGVDAALDTLGGDPLTGSQGGSIGLGFAIPVNQARRVIVQLIRTGSATHSVLGANLNRAYAGTGAQIATTGSRGQPPIDARGPAGKAGLRPGDVIIRLGNQSVTSAYSLEDAIRSLPPGSRVAIRFIRQGTALRTSLVLGSARS